LYYSPSKLVIDIYNHRNPPGKVYWQRDYQTEAKLVAARERDLERSTYIPGFVWTEDWDLGGIGRWQDVDETISEYRRINHHSPRKHHSHKKK
jgi:hypothetical protein